MKTFLTLIPLTLALPAWAVTTVSSLNWQLQRSTGRSRTLASILSPSNAPSFMSRGMGANAAMVRWDGACRAVSSGRSRVSKMLVSVASARAQKSGDPSVISKSLRSM